MHALKLRGILEEPTFSAHSIELRRRVENLESLRDKACSHRDRESVDNIDSQIKHAVCEWIDSLIVGLEQETIDRKMGRVAEIRAA